MASDATIDAAGGLLGRRANTSVTSSLQRGTTTDSLRSTTASSASCSSAGFDDEVLPTAGTPRWRILSLLRSATNGKASSAAFDDPENAVIIFDWDDTLCPTWWASTASGVEEESDPEIEVQSDALSQHALAVLHVLRAARAVARVAIVTLGTREWVAASARRLFPSLNMEAVMLELGITVYHAVVLRGCRNGTDPRVEAKKKAMSKCLQHFYGYSSFGGPRWNVLSIGDSEVEQCALKEVLKDHSRSPLCKTVKLATDPTLQQLTSQLESLSGNLLGMVVHDKDFDRTSSALWLNS